MKKLWMKLAFLLLGMSLVSMAGCSTNTQEQNTTTGVVAGAVVGGLAGSAIGAGAGKVIAIGVGAIAGALVGGAIGHSMDSSDNMKTTYVMENSHTNKATRWTNTKTGNQYTVIPTSKRMAWHGYSDCRTYRSVAIISGKKQVVTGVACRQTDGSWRTMNS